jgi:hypothetical protein
MSLCTQQTQPTSILFQTNNEAGGPTAYPLGRYEATTLLLLEHII